MASIFDSPGLLNALAAYKAQQEGGGIAGAGTGFTGTEEGPQPQGGVPQPARITPGALNALTAYGAQQEQFGTANQNWDTFLGGKGTGAKNLKGLGQEWYDSINNMDEGWRDQYFAQDPQAGFRYYATGKKLGDYTADEVKQNAARVAEQSGIAFDGAGTRDQEYVQGKNGQYLLTDLSGRYDDDITKWFSPQDLERVGTYVKPDGPSGFSEITDTLGMLAAPFTGGLSMVAAKGAQALGGETLHGGDYLQAGAALAGGQIGAGGIGDNAIGNQIGAFAADRAGDYGKQMEQDREDEFERPKTITETIFGPEMGTIGDVIGPGGMYDIVVQDRPAAPEPRPPGESAAGGGSEPSPVDQQTAGTPQPSAPAEAGDPNAEDEETVFEGIQIPEPGSQVDPNHAERDEEPAWIHTNPDGTVVAGNEMGEIWEIEPEPEGDDIDLILSGDMGDLEEDSQLDDVLEAVGVTGGLVIGGGDGGVSDGTAGTGTSDTTGDGDGQGDGDGDGDGDNDGQQQQQTPGGNLLGGGGAGELFDYTQVLPPSPAQLQMFDYVASLRNR